MAMFSDQEKEDLISALDQHLEVIYEEYDMEDSEPSYKAYILRIADLFYVFTGADWESASGTKFTEGGQRI